MSTRKNVRLKHITEKTGFSIKTVARALNDHPDVSENTREKILAIAKEYGYYPNLVAKSLRTKKVLKENDVDIDESLVKTANRRVDGGYKATFELMETDNQRPTAIFIGNSMMAIGVYKPLKK